MALLTKKQKKLEEFRELAQWLLIVSDDFIFTGSSPAKYWYPYAKDGMPALEAFHLIESRGFPKRLAVSEPEKLQKLLRTKAAINMQIKLWAEGRADGTLPKDELRSILEEYKAPQWVFEAVENQKYKYYEQSVRV